MVERRQAGHALLLALVVMVLVASAAALLSAQFGLRARLVTQEARRIQLGALNDAVVAESLARFAKSPGFHGVDQRPFSDGLVSSQVRTLPDDQAVITAIATYRGWTRRTETLVQRRPTGIFTLAWKVLPTEN